MKRSKLRTQVATAWWVGTLVLIACGDGPQSPGERLTVTVEPVSDTLNAVGDTLRLTATVLDDAGRVLPDAVVEWRSLDGSVASVDETGRVVGLAEGLARIRAATGDAADTAAVLVRAGVPTAEMKFVKFSSVASDRVSREGSFWAVKGEDRRLMLRYAPEPGEAEGEEFLEFKVKAESLWRRPDGSSFVEGDSILITVTVEDSTGFVFRFEPSGLKFDPKHPARLDVTYRYADDDLDGDGGVDDDDDVLEQQLGVWQQEQPDAPWTRLYSVKFEDLDEIEALVYGFTGFALASN